MPNNTKSFFKSFRYLFLIFVFVVGLITIVASGGGGGSDDSSGTTDGPTDTTTDDTTTPGTSAYDPANLPNGPFFSGTAYNLDTATDIFLNGSSITVNPPGGGATINGSIATITSSGTYNIHGDLDDGQVIVNVDTTADTGDVSLYLNSANIKCLTTAPIDIESAERVIIVLADDTTNYLTDGATNTALDEDGDLIDSTLYSKDDLVIYGGGLLVVDSNFNNGIKSKDGLIIHSGTINVTSVDDGIIGKNYISVESGNITVTAGGDGLKSTNDGDITQGYIYIKDGLFDITSGADALQVETHIVVAGGTFDLFTAGGSGNTTFNKDLYTAKGLKGPVGVTVFSGVFDIDSADDAIHSNDTIVIHGGEFSLASGDDAIHADLALTINDGDIDVSTCYEGIESLVITINDGDIHVFSTDDPINATDGSGLMTSTVGWLYINGGYTYLDCVNADGLDSNGTVVMKGGTVIVNGPVTGANGILDYASFTMSGGFIIGAGTSNMAQAPGSQTSAQYALLFLFTTQYTDKLFHIETSGGEDIVTFLPAKAYQSIVFSSPDLAAGDYVYNIGGTYSGGTVADGLYQGGTYSVGTDTSFTISSKVTTIGTAPGGGPGGGMPIP
jgi:hypothetical protein